MSNVVIVNNDQKQMVNSLLTDSLRRKAYVVYAFLGLVLGSTQTVYWSLEMGQPKWLIASLAVYAYIGVTFGLVAGNNVSKPEQPKTVENYQEEIPADSVLAGGELPPAENYETPQDSDVDSNEEAAG